MGSRTLAWRLHSNRIRAWVRKLKCYRFPSRRSDSLIFVVFVIRSAVEAHYNVHRLWTGHLEWNRLRKDSIILPRSALPFTALYIVLFYKAYFISDNPVYDNSLSIQYPWSVIFINAMVIYCEILSNVIC